MDPADEVETHISSSEDTTDVVQAQTQKDSAIVQETIRVAIQRLSKGGKANVTKKHILKTLFLAKKRLPDDNQVKRALAYYWYMEGPYSEVVYANLDLMVENGLVTRRKTATSETYRLAPERALQPVTTDADLDTARDEIGLVASEFSNVHIAVTKAYETAPFKWYITYNQEFRPKLASYCEEILADLESRRSAHDTLERLDDAVLDYPTDRAFIGHRAVFMDYAKMLNAFLRWDSHHTRKDMMKLLRNLSDSIWTAFARGVRIYHHDQYYDDCVDSWETLYKRQLADLDHTIRRKLAEFDEVVVDDVKIDPDVVDVIQHPEKYKFVPWVPSVATEYG